MDRRRYPLFDTYFRRLKVDAFHEEVSRHGSAVRQLVDEVLPLQQERLRAIRDAGPWDAEYAVLRRLQQDQAQRVILRMKQQRQLREEVRELERTLPPRTGWNRLRYVNPLIPMWTLLGLVLAQSGYVWAQALFVG